MVKKNVRNWDNKTWLSSQKYINAFNSFLLKNFNLSSNSKILDIGCGRGKILGALNSKFKFKIKPLGIDIINHKDRDKRINFKKISALDYSSASNQKFDLILIKQTIHLMKLAEIKRLLRLLKKKLNSKGKILIFTLETNKNEIPTFKLMKHKLEHSLKRDKEILKIVTKLYPYRTKKYFFFDVKVHKKEYIKMIKNKYISTLVNFSREQIDLGVQEIELKYKNIIRFKDKLICIIL